MQRKSYMPVFLAIIITLSILLGIGLRVHFLNSKVYWEDETFTALRVAGYTRQELIDENFNGVVINSENLLRYQSINSDKSALDTIKSLADDAHPPLYFLLLRLWAKYFGDSITALRSFSAVSSILILPCLFLLAQEIFKSTKIAYLATGLNAASPFYIMLSHEARMYALWTVLTTLSYLFLLRSIQHNTTKNWCLYTLATLTALYIHWFSILTIASQCLYLLMIHNRWSLRCFSKPFIYACIAIFLGFLPWPVFIGTRITHLYTQTTWTGENIGLFGEQSLLEKWLVNLSSIFINTSPSRAATWFYETMLQPVSIGLVVAGMLILAIYLMLRSTQIKTWSLLLIITANVYFPLALADILLGGYRSGIIRYLASSLIGTELLVAYLLFSSGQTLRSSSITWLIKTSNRLVWGLASGLIIAGVVTQTLFQINFDRTQQPLVKLATLLNQYPQPLLVSDIRPTQLLPLAHELSPHVSMQFVTRPQLPNIPSNFSDIFLYKASNNMQTHLTQQGYSLEPVDSISDLLRLTGL